MRLNAQLRTDTGWEVVEDVFDANRTVTRGLNMLCGNGAFGYRGTRADQKAQDYVGWTVADTYDMADGKWRELSNVPNGLYQDLKLNGEALTFDPEGFDFESLHMNNGVFRHCAVGGRYRGTPPA